MKQFRLTRLLPASFFLFSFFLFSFSYAQTPGVQLSQYFSEPGEGFDKIVLLDNGNTCYLHFDRKQGICVNLYDTARQLLATDTITGQLWDAKNINDTEIDGIWNINGQVVIFLQQLIKYKPCLFRLVLDGNTGKLVKEDKLGELPTILHRDVVVQDNLASHDVFVVRDRHSDHYAVALFSGGELQRKENAGERIQVLHFAPDHQLIQQAVYNLPDDNYPYHAFLDMAVQGRDRIFLATAALSTRKNQKDTASIVVVSMLQTGDPVFKHQFLPYTANFTDIHASLQYVPVKDRLQLLLTTTTGKPGKTAGLDMYLNYLNAATLQLQQYRPVTLDKISAFAQQQIKYTGAFTGQPQLMTTHEDGSITLLLENTSMFSLGTNAWNKLHTNLNDIGISHIDTAGKEDAGSALIKMQVANGAFEPLYLHRKNKGQWMFRNRIQALNTTPFLSFDHLPVKQGAYILFNDYLQYLDRGGTFEGKKPLRYLTDANIVCYSSRDSFREPLFLFGKPETYKGYYCMLGASDYQEEKGTYATILITRTGEEKKACIAWIEF